jgi:hypothetical protein
MVDDQRLYLPFPRLQLQSKLFGQRKALTVRSRAREVHVAQAGQLASIG